MSGKGSRRPVLIWMVACIATVALSACIIVNPPPAATPTPVPTATPTRQTAIDVVAIVEGGDPVVIGQTVRAALALDDDSYTDRGRWQWERSDDGLTGWNSVPGARLTDSSLYAPVAADVGKYLRASVSFVDNDANAKTGLSSTVGPVVAAEIETDHVEYILGDDPVVAGRALRVRLDLRNSRYSEPGRWRWDRSDNGLRGWVDVTDYDADNPETYTPSATERNQYLRVSIVYLDSEENRKRGLGQTVGPITIVETVAGVVDFGLGHNPPTVDAEVRVGLNLSNDKYSDLEYWKWERSRDGLGGWEDVTDYDATDSSRYTPSAEDKGKYLRASAIYVDSEGDSKRGLSQTIGPVVE